MKKPIIKCKINMMNSEKSIGVIIYNLHNS